MTDDKQRVAMVETLTVDGGAAVAAPVPRFRYQLGNHLGSSSVELDETGQIITYEEYFPFGATSFHSAIGGLEVSAKRYRYTGKERDDETGLSYHGARYYAPWLGRWTSADPAGMVDGTGLYRYVRNNPITASDPTGHLSWWEEALDSVVNPTNPIAKGITDNLAKRGEALVHAPGAIVEVVKKDGVAGLAKAVGAGAHHLVKDTGEALGDIAWEAAHYEGAKSQQKIASRATDVVLNTAEAVTLVAGGVGAAKGGLAVARSVTTTVREGMAVLKSGTPTLAVVGGGVKGGAAVAGAAAVTIGAPGLTAVGGTMVLMSTAGKGAGAKPGEAGSQPSQPQPQPAPPPRPTASGKPLPDLKVLKLSAQAEQAVQETIEQIEGLRPGPAPGTPKSVQWGEPFRNIPRGSRPFPDLPKRPAGYYREYTVLDANGARGSSRILAGRNGELYYTDSHYGANLPKGAKPFTQIR